jgi:hypothetical protein
MSTKYIIANVTLPLIIKDDGSYVVLSENVDIKFSNHVGELLSPKECDRNSTCLELSNIVSNVLSITKKEISNETNAVVKHIERKIRKNITFKNSSKINPKKYTIKYNCVLA